MEVSRWIYIFLFPNKMRKFKGVFGIFGEVLFQTFYSSE
jgi:hypothetical protein